MPAWACAGGLDRAARIGERGTVAVCTGPGGGAAMEGLAVSGKVGELVLEATGKVSRMASSGACGAGKGLADSVCAGGLVCTGGRRCCCGVGAKSGVGAGLAVSARVPGWVGPDGWMGSAPGLDTTGVVG